MMRMRSLGMAVAMMMVAACGGGGGEEERFSPDDAAPAATPPAPSAPAQEVPHTEDTPTDADPDGDADPEAPSPPDDPTLPPATQEQLIRTFAPRLHLHPDDTTRPANVDWYLARVSMRYNHPSCPDHEVLPLGMVTQAALGVQSHEDDKALCLHDGSDVRKSTTSEGFFLEVASSATYAGAPRSAWKTYVVWRPKAAGLVDVEYWTFYAYNDGFLGFNHEADWEHVTVTIDPKANGAQGKLTQVMFSAHKGGTTLKAGDAQLQLDGTHPVSYVAKGTHANYPKPGSYDIPGIPLALGKDHAAAAPAADVWKQESTVTLVGTRAAPKSGQSFVKYWGRWGQIGTNSETSGITRHFP